MPLDRDNRQRLAGLHACGGSPRACHAAVQYQCPCACLFRVPAFVESETTASCAPPLPLDHPGSARHDPICSLAIFWRVAGSPLKIARPRLWIQIQTLARISIAAQIANSTLF